MTVTEIAKLAGVSKACVSRYFNHGYVSEEKRNRIREVIQQTGYVPAKKLQTPVTEVKQTIGVIIPKINSESISRMVAGISQVLNREGYRMLLADTENNVERELQYLQSFQKDELSGVIISATIFTEKHHELLQALGVPVVVLGQNIPEYSCVYHDDYGAAYAMGERLLSLDRRHFGAILVTRQDTAAGEERYRGFTDALKSRGMDIPEGRIMYSEFSLESGHDAAEKLLSEYPDTDAIFCATDSIAIGAMQYLKGIGKRIPEDVAVTGIGHSRMTEIVSPTVTTAHLFYKTTGIEGADMLLKIIDKGIDMRNKLKMGYEVIQQESC
ncbi:MAG: LacI family DNA-binding transcriptional regulator [Lachnospiraceae bacterium]|nr:LacI family DNA-binding transcriptional regulator [Lachnospiraceae bacterium]